MTYIDILLIVWLLVLTAVVIRHVKLTGEILRKMSESAPKMPEQVALEAHVAEWWQGYYASPEGSPKRAAYEARLRSVGVL